MPTHARKLVVTRGDSLWGRVALKLVVATLVWVKLLINLWQFVIVICYGKKLLQETTGIRLGRIGL